ncbi:MAG: HAMP domain-containing histidine kinase [Chthoniobacter sp.]|nr:HAMP domain-containing histidine kinase [Chthoniobacter sp.]
MTISKRIGLSYILIAVASVVIIAWFGYHEFVQERAEFDALGLPEVHTDLSAEILTVCFFGALPLILLLGWWWIRHVLKPLGALTAAVEKIHAHNLREPLPRNMGDDEVDKLAAVFNSMTTRLNDSFTRIHEFTLRASHELKTPLTVMRAHLETALREGQSLPREQTEWIDGQLDEVKRLAQIVDSLTLLTKADAGLVKLEQQPLQLTVLVEEAIEDAQVLARPHGVTVTLGECADAVVNGDRHRLRQLLLILSDNAVKYNRPGGTIGITLRHTAGMAELRITNTSDELPQGMLDTVFDRFARGRNAQGKVEGCGLGLTIAQWIVQAHGGTIQLLAEDAGRTTALVRLPLAHTTQPAITEQLAGV